MTGEKWAYICSICKQVIAVDDIRSHTEEERTKPTWPGHMEWTRVDFKPEADGFA